MQRKSLHGRPLFVLFTVINLLNYVDRGVIPGASQEFDDFIQNSVVTSEPDVFLGLLQSSFIVGFCTACMAFARLAHSRSPFSMMGLGLIVWCASVLMAGVAKEISSYAFLVLARILSGVGEASFATVIPPIITKTAPPGERGTWLAMFYAAIPVGMALGYVYGSFLANSSAGWAWAFYIEAACMFPLALTCLLVPPQSASIVSTAADFGITIHRNDNASLVSGDLEQSNVFFTSSSSLTKGMAAGDQQRQQQSRGFHPSRRRAKRDNSVLQTVEEVPLLIDGSTPGSFEGAWVEGGEACREEAEGQDQERSRSEVGEGGECRMPEEVGRRLSSGRLEGDGLLTDPWATHHEARAGEMDVTGEGVNSTGDRAPAEASLMPVENKLPAPQVPVAPLDSSGHHEVVVLPLAPELAPEPSKPTVPPSLYDSPSTVQLTSSGEEEVLSPLPWREEVVSVMSRPVFCTVVFGTAACSAVSVGMSTFGTGFVVGLGLVQSESEAAALFGVVVSLAGLIGTLTGGSLIDRSDEEGRLSNGSKLRVVLSQAVGLLCGATCLLVAACTRSTLMPFVILLFLGISLLFASTPHTNLIVMLAVAPRSQSLALAINAVGLHALGDVPSPIIVGALKDALAPHCASRAPLSSSVIGSSVVTSVSNAMSMLFSYVLGPDGGDSAALYNTPESNSVDTTVRAPVVPGSIDVGDVGGGEGGGVGIVPSAVWKLSGVDQECRDERGGLHATLVLVALWLLWTCLFFALGLGLQTKVLSEGRQSATWNDIRDIVRKILGVFSCLSPSCWCHQDASKEGHGQDPVPVATQGRFAVQRVFSRALTCLGALGKRLRGLLCKEGSVMEDTLSDGITLEKDNLEQPLLADEHSSLRMSNLESVSPSRFPRNGNSSVSV